MIETKNSEPQQAEGEIIPSFAEAPAGFLLGTVTAVFSSVGTLWIGFLMALIVADVLGRNFFNAPITGVSEIAGHSVVAIVFLQTAAAIMQGRLTRADFLFRRIADLSPRSGAALESLFCLTGTLVFGLVAWASWDKMITAFTRDEFFGVQGVFTVPTWPFRAIIVIGSIVAALAALYRTIYRNPLPTGQVQ